MVHATLVQCPHCEIGWPPDDVKAHTARCPVRSAEMRAERKRVKEFEDYVEYLTHRWNETGGVIMGFTKHGEGALLPDPEQDGQKTAAKAAWTEQDDKELAKENDVANDEE